MGKKITKSKIQEWKGLDRIQQVVHEELKCVYREISKDDYGIDGEIQLVTPSGEQEYETTGGILKFQAKSGMSYIVQDKDDSFSCKVREKDLKDWHQSNFPILFIIYHSEDDQLYWKHINNYINNVSNVWKKPHKIRFDKSKDIFGTEVYEKLLELGEIAPPRVDFNTKERLISNLLRIKKLPEVWSAPTSVKKATTLFESIEGHIPPFRLFKNRLYSFSYLADERSVFKEFCNISEMRKEQKEKLWEDNDTYRLYISLLNKLVGDHLYRRGVHYSNDFRRSYFALPNKESKEFKRGWFNVRTHQEVRPRIIVKYYEYGLDKFWRHSALEFKFHQIGDEWYMQLMPKFFLTSDGETPYESKRIGRLVTKVKALNYNPGALNDVLFWSDVLASNTGKSVRKRDIEIELFYRPILIIERMPVHGNTNFAPFVDAAPLNKEDSQDQLTFDY
ncbi:DUF4365 domain-containing protein [Halalkalibaculum sp. DA3122]|uniref:DUF4365 domain-containing protein n=1 Tax=Halalkalibaculum sp. DA3122 TaxID=3373607 RepID=UPI0037541BE8